MRQHDLESEQDRSGERGELNDRLLLRHERDEHCAGDEQDLQHLLDEVEIGNSGRVVLPPAPERERRLAVELEAEGALGEHARGVQRIRFSAPRFMLGFAGATAAAFVVLLLEPDLLHAARVFAERTFGFQLDRESPFSIWGWGQYHARGIPDLHLVQQVLQVLVVAGALLVAFVPRQKSILQLAALTAAVLIGFELVLTHWFYLYLPWFFPFVAFAVLYRRDRAAQVH